MKTLTILPLTTIMAAAAAVAFAGGELSAHDFAQRNAAHSAAATRARIAGLQVGLAKLEWQAAIAAQERLEKRAKKVTVVRPVQDKFGDPMYTWYGPLPVKKGTPFYDGPRYAASFDRGYEQPVPDSNYRGYARGSFSQPGLISRTDTVLGVAANSSYMQHGMQTSPGSMYPSAARVMINNP